MINRTTAYALLPLAMGLATACGSTRSVTEPILVDQRESLDALLSDRGNWILLPDPRSDYLPGTIRDPEQGSIVVRADQVLSAESVSTADAAWFTEWARTSGTEGTLELLAALSGTENSEAEIEASLRNSDFSTVTVRVGSAKIHSTTLANILDAVATVDPTRLPLLAQYPIIFESLVLEGVTIESAGATGSGGGVDLGALGRVLGVSLAGRFVETESGTIRGSGPLTIAVLQPDYSATLQTQIALKKAAEAAEAELEALKKQLKDSAEEAEANLERIKNDLTESNNDRSKLSKEIAALESARAQLKKKISAARTEIDRLCSYIKGDAMADARQPGRLEFGLTSIKNSADSIAKEIQALDVR